jgi:CheY-like chemotaxis protein
MESFVATILVIDDEFDTREVLKDRLESLNYRVLTAATGEEGLERLERENPQMVLLDIELPDMNGLEMLGEIRKREHAITVVIPRCASRSDPGRRALRCRAAGRAG